MRDWRNSGVRQMIDRQEGCKRCATSRGLKKIKDAVSRTAERLKNLWNRRQDDKKDK